MTNAELSRAAWRKSSRSAAATGNCVELSWDGRAVSALRDSKNPAGGVLTVDMRPFIQSIKNRG
jgi:hypothetical protein